MYGEFERWVAEGPGRACEIEYSGRREIRVTFIDGERSASRLVTEEKLRIHRIREGLSITLQNELSIRQPSDERRNL